MVRPERQWLGMARCNNSFMGEVLLLDMGQRQRFLEQRPVGYSSRIHDSMGSAPSYGGGYLAEDPHTHSCRTIINLCVHLLVGAVGKSPLPLRLA